MPKDHLTKTCRATFSFWHVGLRRRAVKFQIDCSRDLGLQALCFTLASIVTLRTVMH